MHGQNVRPEKEQKEAEYRESWPCFARMLKDRSVLFDKQSHGVLFYTGCTERQQPSSLTSLCKHFKVK